MLGRQEVWILRIEKPPLRHAALGTDCQREDLSQKILLKT